MLEAKEKRWLKRLVNKNNVEVALEEYNRQLDEAWMKFQVCSILKYQLWDLQTSAYS